MSKLLWIVLIFALMGPIYRPGAARAALRNPVSVAGLHRFEEGSGPVVLVVHGGPGFAPEKPWAGAALLKDRYRFVYYHQRGCGRSVRPLSSLTGRTDQRIKQVESTLGLAAQIADIERLRQDLGAERLILAGHSFGADIATLYAAEFPERVSAMLCIAPAGLHVLPKRQGDLFSTVRKQLPPAMLAEYDAYLKEYFDFSAALQRTEKESSEFYARFAKYYGAAVKLSFAAAPGMLPGYEPLGIYLSMGQHHDYTTAYRGMRAPVLVLHGAADLQPEADSRAFAALFSNVEFARVEGATHFLYDDRPEDFARLAGGFLDRRILSRAQR
jgi:proline iminopeptidase